MQQTPDGGRTMKRRILFVDDERNFLEGVRLMLRGQRDVWDLSFATSADEALEKAAETDFHAIVSDVTMPGKSGLDLLSALRERGVTERTPVVILTGNAEADLKRRALDLGAADLLNKPVTTEDLLARLRSVLRLRAYQDELKEYNEHLERKVQERTCELEHSRRDILWRLAKAGEFRDEETGDHVIRVACCSRALAEALGLDMAAVRAIFFTSPLYDIGKIGVPDVILLKRDALDPGERRIMERHCEIGVSILLDRPKGARALFDLPGDLAAGLEAATALHDELRDMAATIIMAHHEQWDGAGYPNRLKGGAIPLPGRIVALCDVYDALRSRRPYKEAMSVEKTREILASGSGSHFDPEVHAAFQRVADEFEDIRARYSA
jgi:putative two-component system response regulator